MALSLIKAKYIVVEARNKMLWMKWFLQKLRLKQKEYVLFCDNQSAINLSKNPMYHSCMKHRRVIELVMFYYRVETNGIE